MSLSLIFLISAGKCVPFHGSRDGERATSKFQPDPQNTEVTGRRWAEIGATSNVRVLTMGASYDLGVYCKMVMKQACWIVKPKSLLRWAYDCMEADYEKIESIAGERALTQQMLKKLKVPVYLHTLFPIRHLLLIIIINIIIIIIIFIIIIISLLLSPASTKPTG